MSTSPRRANAGKPPVNGSPYRIRDSQAAALTEVWLVSAVLAILGIRLYLHITGYPQVGGDTLHIAHMLWGGLGMVISMGILFIFASDAWKPFAAFVGGLGFGTFIDELGKFITKDNDYFFEPTIGLIYGVLVVLYLFAQWWIRRREPTTADHLFYMTQGLQSLAIGKLDRERQRLALGHLDAAKIDTPFTRLAREQLENAPLIGEDDVQSSRILRMRDHWMQAYATILDRHWFVPIVIGLFVIKVGQIVAALIFGFATDSLEFDLRFSVVEWGTYLSGAASGFIAVVGLWFLVRNLRVKALELFAASTLVTILFGQFFAFTTNQFAAFGSLLVQLVVLGILRFAIAAEEHANDHMEGNLPAEGRGTPSS